MREERAATAALPETERDARGAALDRREALLDETIAALTVLGPDAAPHGKVAFATWVTVEDDAGEQTTWRIVGPDEADARRGLLSAHAPVARALLGREPGEVVVVERPGGARELTILVVRPTPPT